MFVYIEYAILDNLVIDSLLLIMVARLLKLKIHKLKIFCASVLGTSFAIILPLVDLNQVLSFALKALTGILMVYVAFSFKSKKNLILSEICFFSFTFLLGGAITGIFNMLKINFSLSNGFYYKSKYPICAALIALAILYYFLEKAIKAVYKKTVVNSYIYDTEIFLNGQSVKVKGFLDSGNQLYDSKENLPVIIIGKSVVGNLFKEGILTNSTKARYLEFSTISGKSKMLVFSADKIIIYYEKSKIITNAILGVSPHYIKGNEDYEVILHASLLKEINTDVQKNTLKFEKHNRQV